MPMICCRKPGFVFTRCDILTAQASPCFHGSMQLHAMFELTTIGNRSGPLSANKDWRQCRQKLPQSQENPIMSIVCRHYWRRFPRASVR